MRRVQALGFGVGIEDSGVWVQGGSSVGLRAQGGKN